MINYYNDWNAGAVFGVYGVRPAMHLDLNYLLTNMGYEITANANGGTISAADGWTLETGNASAKKTLDPGAAYGTLPLATREGHTFDGWYSKDGTTTNDWGVKIEPTTVIDAEAP